MPELPKTDRPIYTALISGVACLIVAVLWIVLSDFSPFIILPFYLGGLLLIAASIMWPMAGNKSLLPLVWEVE